MLRINISSLDGATKLEPKIAANFLQEKVRTVGDLWGSAWSACGLGPWLYRHSADAELIVCPCPLWFAAALDTSNCLPSCTPVILFAPQPGVPSLMQLAGKQLVNERHRRWNICHITAGASWCAPASLACKSIVCEQLLHGESCTFLLRQGNATYCCATNPDQCLTGAIIIVGAGLVHLLLLWDWLTGNVTSCNTAYQPRAASRKLKDLALLLQCPHVEFGAGCNSIADVNTMGRPNQD